MYVSVSILINIQEITSTCVDTKALNRSSVEVSVIRQVYYTCLAVSHFFHVCPFVISVYQLKMFVWHNRRLSFHTECYELPLFELNGPCLRYDLLMRMFISTAAKNYNNCYESNF